MSLKTADPMNADELFRRFDRVFGQQKTAAHWGMQDMELVKADWNAELGKFTRETHDRAMSALTQQGASWPPTLGEFVQLCRQFNRPEHQQMAQIPMSAVPQDQAKRNIAAIRAMIRGSIKRMPGS